MSGETPPTPALTKTFRTQPLPSLGRDPPLPVSRIQILPFSGLYLTLREMHPWVPSPAGPEGIALNTRIPSTPMKSRNYERRMKIYENAVTKSLLRNYEISIMKVSYEIN